MRLSTPKSLNGFRIFPNLVKILPNQVAIRGFCDATKGKQKGQEGQKRQRVLLPFLPFLPFLLPSQSWIGPRIGVQEKHKGQRVKGSRVVGKESPATFEPLS